MSGAFDPKELKVLSDILALVLEEQEGQSVAALNALRSRARKSGTTGGALKNLFVAIAPNPPQRAKPKPRATKTETGPDVLAARQQIVTLTNNLRQMDLELRNSRARLESVRSELYQTQQSRAELQSRLLTREARKPYFSTLIWCGFAVGILIGIAGTQFIHSVVDVPRPDKSIYLH
ncbi:hypothetical protein [Asaia krungthepensis]|uniref:Uncharacterized protein n=1 Tax=Asaia krungthepensis NRIC 0535 TaxID=1307925 RepID=A0ABQ0PYY3_9PROT|nr:hypothetical protein [Asaia krungthepensis]GBQ85046.1 hypothetical protein AA0535_0659 [Asaia krungthepensis NRIC 0535]